MRRNSSINLISNSANIFIGVLFLFSIITGAVYAETELGSGSGAESESQVIQKFTSQEISSSEHITIGDQRKRQVMFAMGVPLLLFIIITVVLGISMGVYGKNVYIPHMIFAGLSLTLALAHAIVGLVWFWPF